MKLDRQVRKESERDITLSRKLKIENWTRCMNCNSAVFTKCKEPFKEDIVDCSHFVELAEHDQVVVIKLCEWCKK